MMQQTFAFLAVLLTITTFVAQAEPPASALAQQRARKALDKLQDWYDEDTGLWKTTSWWNSANALTALIHYTRITGDDTFAPIVANTFDICKDFEVTSTKTPSGKRSVKDFLNPWYDDEGWWVLVWIDAYDLTGDIRYLKMSQVIFADMTTGWDDVCGGGVYWKKPKVGKHAITNELFLLGAIRLHARTLDDSDATVNGRTYLQWSLDTYNWIKSSGMINDRHLVENGLDDGCRVQPGRYYTYNQGIILSCLVELTLATHDDTYVSLAQRIANASLEHLVYEDGILKDPTEPQVTGDSVQFKGVFMRHLTQLYQHTGDRKYGDFILQNADSIWNRARKSGSHEIGSLWTGPFDEADAARQSCALDALNAAIVVNQRRGSGNVTP